MIDNRPKKIDSYIGHGFWVATGPERQPAKFKVTQLDVRYNECGERRIIRLAMSDGKWHEVFDLFASKKDFFAARRQILEQESTTLRLQIAIEAEKLEDLKRRLKNIEELQGAVNQNVKNC